MVLGGSIIEIRSVDNNVSKRTTSRRQEVTMAADTHDPHFFSINVSIQNPINSLSSFPLNSIFLAE